MVVLKHKNIRHVACLSGLVLVLISACQQTCPTPHEAATSEAACPKCARCDAQVTLSSLDRDARDRLKGEVMEEIYEELKAQWWRECRDDSAKNGVLSSDNASAQCQIQLTECQQALKQTASGVDEVNKPSKGEGDKTVTTRKRRPVIDLPPTQPIEKDERGLKIMRQAFATQIVRRLPVDERESFTIEDGSIFCFVEVASNEENERQITLKFTHSTGLTQSYELPIGQSPAWRTWSKLNLTSSMTGAWLCEVFNEEGVLLASKSFVVE